MSLRIERVRPDHGILEFSAMNRRAFPPHLHPWLSQCQSGYDRYLRSPAAAGGDETWIALDDGRLVGFAQWRIADDFGFFNYLAIDPSVHNQGVGRKMVKAVIAFHALRTVQLDVFVDEPALSYWIHMGFQLSEHRTWHRHDVPRPPAGTAHIQVTDPDAIRHRMRDFEFGHVEGTWDGQPVWLHFPSPSTVRLPHVDHLADDRLLAAVRALVPSVELAAAIEISDHPAEPPRGELPPLRAARMLAAAADVPA